MRKNASWVAWLFREEATKTLNTATTQFESKHSTALRLKQQGGFFSCCVLLILLTYSCGSIYVQPGNLLNSRHLPVYNAHFKSSWDCQAPCMLRTLTMFALGRPTSFPLPRTSLDSPIFKKQADEQSLQQQMSLSRPIMSPSNSLYSHTPTPFLFSFIIVLISFSPAQVSSRTTSSSNQWISPKSGDTRVEWKLPRLGQKYFGQFLSCLNFLPLCSRRLLARRFFPCFMIRWHFFEEGVKGGWGDNRIGRH